AVVPNALGVTEEALRVTAKERPQGGLRAVYDRPWTGWGGSEREDGGGAPARRPGAGAPGAARDRGRGRQRAGGGGAGALCRRAGSRLARGRPGVAALLGR